MEQDFVNFASESSISSYFLLYLQGSYVSPFVFKNDLPYQKIVLTIKCELMYLLFYCEKMR